MFPQTEKITSLIRRLEDYNSRGDENNLMENSGFEEIIPKLGQCLCGDYSEVPNYVQNLMQLTCKYSCPDDLILMFCEEFEKDLKLPTFKAYLQILPTCLRRLPEKRMPTSITWCLYGIQQCYLKTTKENMEQDIKLHTIRDFYQNLISEITDNPRNKTIIGGYLIDIFQSSIFSQGIVTILIEEYVELALKANRDIFIYLYKDNEKNWDQPPEFVSLGILYYYILTKGIHLGSIPKVYDPIFLLHNVLNLTEALFLKNHVKMALQLSTSLLELVKHLKLPYELLECRQHRIFCENLARVMIYDENESNRLLALKLFQQYLWNFEDKGRCCIIYNVYNSVENSNFRGYLIIQYKDMLMHCSSEHLRGEHFTRVLRRFLLQITCDTIDFVEYSDQIIATLNLVRFLLLNTATGLIIEIEVLRNLLKTTGEGVAVARGYYEASKHALNEDRERERQDLDDGSIKTIITDRVSGQGISAHMPFTERIQNVELCSTTIDMIDSLRERCQELLTLFIKHCSVVKRTCTTSSTHTIDDTQNGGENTENYDELIRNRILEASLTFVSQYGWTKKALNAGATSLGYSEAAHAMFNGGGGDLVLHFQKKANFQLVDCLKQWSCDSANMVNGTNPANFVEQAVKYRLQLIVPYRDNWGQAMALMALPPNMTSALATLLTAVDDICYYAGDRSVDFNWYARRVGVAGVYKATELYLLQDKSVHQVATWQFLSRRMSEAVQLYQILQERDLSGTMAKDTVLAAFTTARNILGLNWNR